MNMQSIERGSKLIMCCSLTLCTLLFALWSWRWPLVGDAALMHYTAFLADHGMVPYRDLLELNAPGAWVPDWLVMHTLGGGALAWRVYDLLLGLTGIAAMAGIMRRGERTAGAIAGALFLLVHAQDGIAEAGQRDLTGAVLCLLGGALLVHALRTPAERSKRLVRIAIAFVPLAAALCVKLSLAAFVPAFLLVTCLGGRCEGTPSRDKGWQRLIAGLAGTALPIVATCLFLRRWHVAGIFLTLILDLMRFHAGLGHRSFGYLAAHSFSPVILLLPGWVILCVTQRRRTGLRQGTERLLLFAGAIAGWLAYAIQMKGLPYHRYAFLGFWLPLVVLDSMRALGQTGYRRALGILGLALCSLVLAPRFLWKAMHFNWHNQGTVSVLERDLTALRMPLNGNVQCIDTASGCLNALYNLAAVQRTGFLYDELIFGDGREPAVRKAREWLWSRLSNDPPPIIVVTDDWFLEGPVGYAKLQQWPEFADLLRERYQLKLERKDLPDVEWWSRRQRAAGYRIYIYKPAI